jgi:DNA polymerase-1
MVQQMRGLFTVPDDKVIVGADLSGLELRCLAHYMKDPGYTEEILSGDIHTANQKAAGLEHQR